MIAQCREVQDIADKDELWLKSKCRTDAGPYLLPFEPNSTWKQATVFIVGLNPIESFRHEFASYDHYWHALTKDVEEFEKIRQVKYPARTLANSRTKRRLSALVSKLAPHN